jgi:hypothetical protein
LIDGIDRQQFPTDAANWYGEHKMITPSHGSNVARFELNARVRWVSFLAVFIFMLASFLAMPTSQISAAEGRVNWDNRCITEQCQ